MVYFETKNVNFGIFGKVLGWKFLGSLRPFGIFIAIVVYFMAIWYFCGRLVTFFPILFLLHQEKSGNPAHI
jgi:hypothetical protein